VKESRVKPSDAWRDTAFDRLIARGLEDDRDRSGKACPDADLLAAWFDRSLSEAEAARIESHAGACASCQRILADLARTEPVVVRAAPEPAPARPWHWHWRWLVPLATAVVVVVVGSRTLRAPGPSSGTPPAQAVFPAVEVARAGEVPGPAASAEPSPALSPAPPQASAPAPGTTARALAPARPAAVGDVVAREAVPTPPAAPRSDLAANAASGQPARAEETAKAAPAAPAVLSGAEGVVGGVVAPPGLQVSARRAAAPDVGQAAASTREVRGPSGISAWRWGPGALIEHSEDAGRIWRRQDSGATVRLVAGSAPGDRTCWIVGENGVILRTTDGATWQQLPSPVASDFVAVRATSDVSAVITARDGADYATVDGGRSWRKR
jgi:hypothetical protein